MIRSSSSMKMQENDETHTCVKKRNGQQTPPGPAESWMALFDSDHLAGLLLPFGQRKEVFISRYKTNQTRFPFRSQSRALFFSIGLWIFRFHFSTSQPSPRSFQTLYKDFSLFLSLKRLDVAIFLVIYLCCCLVVVFSAKKPWVESTSSRVVCITGLFVQNPTQPFPWYFLLFCFVLFYFCSSLFSIIYRLFNFFLKGLQ